MSNFIAKKETIELAIHAASTRLMKVKVKDESPSYQTVISPDFRSLDILHRVLKSGKPDQETIQKYRK